MSTLPTISVIIPVYNRVASCIAAIQSVVAQSVSCWELIVVDDGSTLDMSLVEQAVVDSGGHYMRQTRSGVALARNNGVQIATGKWLAFLDSDDLWLPRKLELQLDYAEKFPTLDLHQTQEIWIRHGLRVNPRVRHQKPDGEAFFRSLELCCICPSAVFIRREAFSAAAGFDSRFRVCEDYDLWLRMTAVGNSGLLDQELVIKHGGAADQLSRAEPAMDRFRVFALLKLLANRNGNGSLTVDQQLAVFSVCAAKSKILATGAAKRGYARAEKFYRTLVDAFFERASSDVDKMYYLSLGFLEEGEALLDNKLYAEKISDSRSGVA